MSALAQLLAFLTSAPMDASPASHIRSIHLPTTQLHTEPVSCISHTSRFFITGTDIIRALVFRFRVLHIPIASMKKFEEGVFSDLRNLKVGVGCQLEEPRSPFLVQLHELGCIRTQKKQKVFYWECVNHEYLFQEALGREKKRQTGIAHDGLAMLDAEWRSMTNVWESTVSLKVTVQYMSLPSAGMAAPMAMDGVWGNGIVDPAVLQSPMSSTSPLKAAPLARMAARGLLDNRSRASSSASSNLMGNGYSNPCTPVPAARSLPISMYHLLNRNGSSGIATPDSLFLTNPFGESPAAHIKQGSLWNDEAIAAVTYEVLGNSPDLFNSVCSSNESDPIVEYSNWLASTNNSPSGNELTDNRSASSVFSALSLIEDSGLSMQQLDEFTLFDNALTSDADLLSSLEREIDLAATELLFAQMTQPSESKKRERSNTTASACSARSNKRYQPYHLPGSLVL